MSARKVVSANANLVEVCVENQRLTELEGTHERSLDNPLAFCRLCGR